MVFMEKKEQEMKKNIGAVITEPGSTLHYKTGSWRAFRPRIVQEKCNRCCLCWQYCPDAAIKIAENGKLFIDYNYCKGCMICVRECPAKAIVQEVEMK